MNSDTEPASVQPSDLAISRRSEPGAAPGTLVIDPDAPSTLIRVVEYDTEQFAESDCADTAVLTDRLTRTDGVLWVDAVGLGDRATLTQLGEVFSMHRLVLEDMVNVHQRPKCEDYGDRLFLVTHMPVDTGCETEQVSLFLGPGFVLSVQERPGDCLDPVRQRIRAGSGRLRERGSDYLAYAILDAITDAYFPVLEQLGERLEDLEVEALDSPSLETLARIRAIRRELMSLRRTIWPKREMFNTMLRESTPGITDSTRVYLRDCYDHAVQLLDITDNYRELASGLMDVYLSSTGNRMNEIMKVLTIVATIFIPLTFVAGIYGMNFDAAKSPWNMPELAWKYGYLACLAVMLVMGVGMLLWFRRLGWLGSRSAE